MKSTWHPNLALLINFFLIFIRELLLADFSVTEGDPEKLMPSAYDIALWIFSAGYYRDIDQMPIWILDPKRSRYSFDGNYENY